MSQSTLSRAAARGADAGAVAHTFRKAGWRLLPFLFLCYVVAYLDRTNIGFAQLQMKQDLGFSDAVYGLGAGVFFLGYALCEVPTNLVVKRFGTRWTLARILVPWGLVSIAMIHVSNATSFYVTRFLLGAFEAGLVPAALYFLTHWFPNQRRGNAISLFMLGMPLSGVVGGPLAGWAMHDLQGVWGLHGWQWLFVVEGVPAVLLGLVCPLLLADSPERARWLDERERGVITDALRAEHAGEAHTAYTFLQAIANPRLYVMAAAYFTFICGIYVIGFWLPTVIKSAGVDDVTQIGLYSMIPFAVSAVGMVLLCRRSDARMERRWHLAACAWVGAAMLALIPFVHTSLALSLVVLTVATTAIYSTLPLFWAIPSAYFAGTNGAAGAIALINSLGLIGGFVSPTIVGWLKTATGSLASGLYAMAALLAAGAVCLLVGLSRSALDRGATNRAH
ncbi:MFS transporter [Burkholderia sp. WAC0059]|uniref:MFS transporter n=1 Tax=Burkholderia sp. WAC0059 TaxID=2066022 RepID=UPI002155D402|nr:MFS transporter [Burkholderia sp. WAC0059]